MSAKAGKFLALSLSMGRVHSCREISQSAAASLPWPLHLYQAAESRLPPWTSEEAFHDSESGSGRAESSPSST